MSYEIWEMRTGNLVATFGSEKEALILVRDAVKAHGDAYVESLALVHEEDDGSTTTLATSYALIERAQVAA